MRSVDLVDLTGSRQSAIGQLVGRQTGRHLVDLDLAAARRPGQTVRHPWEEGGEAAYWRLESRAVLRALGSDVPMVLAAPGGVIHDPEYRVALREGFR
jgi:shikimate kinase